MARTKRGVVSRAKHNKVLKSVKGQRGRRKNTIRIARQAMEKAMQYAYRDRKTKKRNFRSLWIQRINAGVREEGITYSKFINVCISPNYLCQNLKQKAQQKKDLDLLLQEKLKCLKLVKDMAWLKELTHK